jgi:integrase
VPRRRTGTLLAPGRDGVLRGRVTVTVVDGEGRRTVRPVYALGTPDKAQARIILEKLVRALEAGANIRDAEVAASAPIRVCEYAPTWSKTRRELDIPSASDEHARLRRHVLPAIGHLALVDINERHVGAVLDAVARMPRDRVRPGDLRATYSRQSVKHVRAAMKGMFGAALREGIIQHNPAANVRIPTIREVRRERVILTDEECTKLVSCPDADLEVRVASVFSRCEGGMRTSDLLRWDWSDIDCQHFNECRIPRAKSSAPKTLLIPPSLAPIVKQWWDLAGRPTSGPVFPVRKGRNAGGSRPTRGFSFARRLRVALFVAGVFRAAPVWVAAMPPGSRTDLGRCVPGKKLAPNPLDEIYFDTRSSRCVDFHSFRRAFSTALAENDVPIQKAMVLAGHTDARTHMGYVRRTARMRSTPAAALPALPHALPVSMSELTRFAGGGRPSSAGVADEHDVPSTSERSVPPTLPRAAQTRGRTSSLSAK